jgi:hypothetical protein
MSKAVLTLAAATALIGIALAADPGAAPHAAMSSDRVAGLFW